MEEVHIKLDEFKQSENMKNIYKRYGISDEKYIECPEWHDVIRIDEGEGIALWRDYYTRWDSVNPEYTYPYFEIKKEELQLGTVTRTALTLPPYLKFIIDEENTSKLLSLVK